MKKWGIAILIVVVIAGLYFIEFSKIDSGATSSNTMPTLDNLAFDESEQNWDDFYRVRATIIDGQSARFSIPEKLKKKEGKVLELMGAAVFFSPGCRIEGDKVAVSSFFLYPTLGLANACEHLPEVAMRWTIRINLKNEWLINRDDMIQCEAKVKGRFRIETEKPYESAFFIDDAVVEKVTGEDKP